jgi:hypothetical protein
MILTELLVFDLFQILDQQKQNITFSFLIAQYHLVADIFG